MNIGLWKITKNERKFADLQWLLFKWFRVKRKYPCGRNAKEDLMCCCLRPNEENSIIINDGNRHEIICKVCGHAHMISSECINSFEELWSDW